MFLIQNFLSINNGRDIISEYLWSKYYNLRKNNYRVCFDHKSKIILSKKTAEKTVVVVCFNFAEILIGI